MPRIQLPVYQNALPNGGVNSSGYLYFYENRSDPPSFKNVFIDPDELVPSVNPVPLDSDGYTPNLFGRGAYTVVCKDQHGVQLWSRDDVVVGTSGGQFADYSPIQLYEKNAIVRAEDGQYYVSLFNQNVNHEPSISPEWWSRTVFLKYWNPDEEYLLGDSVIHGGVIWLSLQGGNKGNEPEEESDWWSATLVGMANPMTAVGDMIVGSAEGTPVRKGIGSENNVLTVKSGSPSWEDPMGGPIGDAIQEISDKHDKQILAPIQIYRDLGAVSGTQNIDLNLGTYLKLTTDGNLTINFTLPDEHDTDTITPVVVEITRPDSHTITHPSGTIWSPNGIAPDITIGGTDTITYTKTGTDDWSAVRSREDSR